jgi:(R,R)-butanediol dehydrogenase / meso-butanediol dehydrogenase / diacetyl reductase
MRVGVYRGIRTIAVEDAPEPVAGPADVVLAVRVCGICGSDLHTYLEGALVEPGQVLGHEFAGEVLEAGGAVEGLAVGDRVTGIPIQPCGDCRRCVEGLGHLCEHMHERGIGFGIQGAFAERVRIPDATVGVNVHPLPAGLSFEDGASVEPLAVAVHCVRRSGARAGQTALVFGLGPIGLHVAQVLTAAGVEPVLGVDPSELRRRKAAELGVVVVADPSDAPAALGGREPDHVFECAGVPSLIQASLELVRPRGTVTVVALYDRTAAIDPMVLLHKEATIVAGAMVTPEDFAESLELLRSGRAVGEPLVTHREKLVDLAAAFELQCDKASAIKVMVSP